MSAPASPRLLVDGTDAAQVPADDRGLLYGDGVFRTIRVVGGRRWLWPAHLARLSHDAAAIGLSGDGLEAKLDADARRLVAGDDGILRITLTRGSGPRGYAPPALPVPRRVLTFTPGMPPVFGGDAVRLQFARTRLSHAPALAGLKHLGRLEQVLACGEPVEPGVFDRLMLDPDGAVVCGTRCNLFLRVGRTLVTPGVERAGVAGVVRGELLAGRVPVLAEWVDACVERSVDADVLAEADEVFVTNAVFGVRAVRSLLDVEGSEAGAWDADGGLAAALGACFRQTSGEGA